MCWAATDSRVPMCSGSFHSPPTRMPMGLQCISCSTPPSSPTACTRFVWVVFDDLGTIEGIGSRFFNILQQRQCESKSHCQRHTRGAERRFGTRTAAGWRRGPVGKRRGLDESPWFLRFTGCASPELRVPRGERVEVALDSWWSAKACGDYAAYLLTGEVGEARFLPAPRWTTRLAFSGGNRRSNSRGPTTSCLSGSHAPVARNECHFAWSSVRTRSHGRCNNSPYEILESPSPQSLPSLC